MSSFDDDGYLGYDPRLASHQSQSVHADSVNDSLPDSLPISNNQSHATGYGVSSSQSMPEAPYPPPIYGSGGGHSAFSSPSEQNGEGVNGDQFGGSDGSILPPPAEMEPEVGSALREWRRENLIRLEEKEKKEKEMVEQIIKEADEYKEEFYRKIRTSVENIKTSNRDKEKIYLENQEKFHTEAEKNYWKAIAELIPHELPTIEKKGKKEKEKQPSIVVIHGPKPGKPTDLSRMRQILVKLKHNPPPHMKTKPPPPADTKKDAKQQDTPATSSSSGPPPPKVEAATNPKSAASA